MDPTTIIADRLASLDDARGHHHIACELLAALQEVGYEVVKVPTFAEISQKLAEEWSAEGMPELTVEWRKWSGAGTPPVGAVDVLYRAGPIETGDASAFRWNRLGTRGDIIAWRPA